MEKLKNKFPVIKSDPNFSIFFGASFAFFVFSILFSVVFYIFMPGVKIANAENSVWTPSADTKILEVNIANNGLVYLKGATVESVDGTTLTVSTSWKLAKIIWTIQTNETYNSTRHFGTKFLDSKGETTKLSDIKIGDTIRVSGVLDLNSSGLNVVADVVRI